MPTLPNYTRYCVGIIQHKLNRVSKLGTEPITRTVPASNRLTSEHMLHNLLICSTLPTSNNLTITQEALWKHLGIM